MRPYTQQAPAPPQHAQSAQPFLPFRPMAGRGQTASTPNAFAPRRGGGAGPSGLSRGGAGLGTAGNTFRAQPQQSQSQAQAQGQGSGQGLGHGQIPTQQQQHTQHSQQQQQQQPQPGLQTQQFGNPGKRPLGAQQQQQQQPPISFAPQAESEDSDFGLTDIQVREISKVFGIFDLDKNGLVDQSEFLLACQAIDIPISKRDATELMQNWGIEKARTTVTNLQLRPKYFLNEDSFFSIVGPRVATRDPGEDAARAFSYIDVDGKGYINHEDLRRVAERVSTIDQTIEDAELAAMLEAADMDGDGIITNEEFFDIAFD